MIKAASRGVKVRLLIDDLASRMYSHEIRLINSHDNIEVRVYNAGFMLGKPHRRVWFMAKNSVRFQNRMHNKAVVIDKQLCITGGRNIADEYFDYHRKFNFRDRDVFIAGKEVNNVVKCFDTFWNDSLTVPYEKLSGKKQNKLLKKKDRFEKLHHKAEKSMDFLPETRKKIELFPQEIDSAVKAGALFWIENVTYVNDKPGKNAQLKKQGPTVCTDTIIALMRKAKKEIIIQNPYFILTDEMRACIKEVIAKGVKIRLLTNSMSSNDSHKAFSAYKRDRKEIVTLGIEVYEFRPNAEIRYKFILPDKQAKSNYKSVYGYHAKTLIIDDDVAMVGSYNFDPRSQIYNTECITIVRSEEYTAGLRKIAEEEFLPANSWRVTLDWNPDKKASLKKKINTLFGMLIPKRYL